MCPWEEEPVEGAPRKPKEKDFRALRLQYLVCDLKGRVTQILGKLISFPWPHEKNSRRAVGPLKLGVQGKEPGYLGLRAILPQLGWEFLERKLSLVL